jgi:hypothetical protein
VIRLHLPTAVRWASPFTVTSRRSAASVLATLVAVLSACGGADSVQSNGTTAGATANSAPSVPAGTASSTAYPEDAALRPTTELLATKKAGGATGGGTANVFADVLDEDEVVRSVTVCAGSLVDSLRLATNKRQFPRQGGGGGICTLVNLNAGENIRQVFGSAGAAIDSIGFVTTQGRRLGPWGNANGGLPFTMTVAGGNAAKFLGWRGVFGVFQGPLVITQLSLLQQGMGGAGGLPFMDRLQADERVTSVRTCWRPSGYVMGVQLITNLAARRFHGGTAADQQCANFDLGAGEYISELVGRASQYVDAVGYITNLGRRSPMFGGPGGEGFSQSLGLGNRFHGLAGSSGGWLDRIGLVEPAGGPGGGSLFEDMLPAGKRVNAIEVCVGAGNFAANYVRSVQAFYDVGVGLPRHGVRSNAGLNCPRVDFFNDEYIVEISGTSGSAIDSIQFRSNRGRIFGPYGGSGPNSFVVKNNWPGFMGFAGTQTQPGNDGGNVLAIDFAGPDSFASVAPPTGTATTQGWWGDLVEWPVLGLHAAVMADGRVMSYGTDASGSQGAQFVFDVWDPSLGTGPAAHNTLPNGLGTDIFCSGQSLMPNGQLLLAGGDARDNGYNKGIRNSTVFNPNANRLEATGLLNQARWYASQKVLRNGEVLVMGGINEAGNPSLIPEVFNGSSWRQLRSVNSAVLGVNYPRMFATRSTVSGGAALWVISTSGDPNSNGRIFRLEVTGNTGQGLLTDSGVRLPAFHSWDRPVVQIARTQVLVQLDSGQTVIVNLPASGVGSDRPSIESAGTLSQPRPWSEMVVLPNGQVLASGGSREVNQLTDVAYHAEIWDRNSKQWTRAASQLRPRLYHSTAVLLTDGRVLVTGGGAPAPTLELNAQIYSPPYLFAAGGAARARPSFSVGTTSLAFGSTATLAIAGAPTGATLVRLGATTHSYNSEQSYEPLTVLSNNGATMTVRMPSNNSVVPGYYMLTVVNASGVPSVSRIIKLG